jgi:hypothetical protein
MHPEKKPDQHGGYETNGVDQTLIALCHGMSIPSAVDKSAPQADRRLVETGLTVRSKRGDGPIILPREELSHRAWQRHKGRLP